LRGAGFIFFEVKEVGFEKLLLTDSFTGVKVDGITALPYEPVLSSA
jgi:hypothetical protein